MSKKFFRIYFSYNGQGILDIEAKSKKEAERLFKYGNWSLRDAVDDRSDHFEIIEIAEGRE